MKRIMTVLVLLVVCLAAGTAGAISLSFVGPSYTLKDSDGDGFSELLRLNTAFVTLADPASDALFADAAFEHVVFSDFVLDPLSFVSGQSYDFTTSAYLEGFKLFDDDQTLLMTADVTLSSLMVDGGTASINPSFGMNLSNLTAGANYQTGSSLILDELLNAPAGALNLTFQIPDDNFGWQIEHGSTMIGTYSGSLAPGAVPEPSTLLLLGGGLLGVVHLGRKKRRIK